MRVRRISGTACEPRRAAYIDSHPLSSRLNSRVSGVLRSVAVTVFAVACTAALTFASTITTAVHLAVSALIMTGTGTPTPSQGYMNAVIRDYIGPATGSSYTGISITTPETVPLNSSVAAGLVDLEKAMAQQQTANPGQPYAIFGFSQSTQIVMAEKRKLSALKASGAPVPDVTLVMFGAGNRPNGGLLSRFPGLYIPIVGIDFDGAAPTDPTNGVKTVDISRQYDFFGDVPNYPINVLADLNAVLGLLYVHNTIADGTTPLTGPFADQYVEGSPNIVKQQRGDTTFYLIPTANLPLFGPLRSLGVPEGLIDIVEPAARVLIEAGYDRPIPMGQPTPAQLIPTIDPVTFTLQLAAAVVQGANNAFALVGGQLPGGAALVNLITAASSVSGAVVGAPYHQVVSAINNAFNPVTAVTQAEGPIAHGAENVLSLTGIPQILGAIAGLAVTALFGPIAAAAPVDPTPPRDATRSNAIATTDIAASGLSLSAPDTPKPAGTSKSAGSAATPTTAVTESVSASSAPVSSTQEPAQSTTTASATAQTHAGSNAAEPAGSSGTSASTADAHSSSASDTAPSTGSGTQPATSASTTNGQSQAVSTRGSEKADPKARPSTPSTLRPVMI
jgi:hypothetical protein